MDLVQKSLSHQAVYRYRETKQSITILSIDAASVLASPLRDIINLSFEKGRFPSSWECAKVTALFKRGDKTDKDNYRPISILPTVSKVMRELFILNFTVTLTPTICLP